MRGPTLATLSLALALALALVLAAACGGGPRCQEDALPGLCGAAPRSVGIGAAIDDAVLIDLGDDADADDDHDEDVIVAISREAAALRISDRRGRVRTIALAGEPAAVAAADLSGDGLADVAVALRSADAVAIFTGTGDGDLHRATTVAVGAAPQDLWIGDLDGDGLAELVTADAGAGGLSILGGDALRARLAGDERPPSITRVDLDGDAPIQLVGADLDGDGKVDLITLDFTRGTVRALRGRGDGGLAEATTILAESDAGSIAVADLDGDGVVDLARQSLVDGAVAIHFAAAGAAPGAAAEALAWAVDPPILVDTGGAAVSPGIAAIPARAGAPGAIAAAVDGALLTWPIDQVRMIHPPTRSAEGGPEDGPALALLQVGARALLLADPLATRVTELHPEVHLGETWGEQSRGPHAFVSGEPGFGDLDGDGALDFAVNTWKGGIIAYHGDGGGGFTAGPTIPAPAGYVLAIADLSGDGRSELAVIADESLWIARQGIDGSFAPAPTIALGHAAVDMIALRSDQGARLAIDLGAAGVAVVEVDAAAALVAVITPRPALAALRLRAADLGGDGDDDLVILGREAGVAQLRVILSQETGFIDGPGWPIDALFAGPTAARDLAIGDLDDDGTIDAVIAADDQVARIHDLVGDAPQIELDRLAFDPALAWGPLSLGDLDGDRALDLLRPLGGAMMIHRGGPRGFAARADVRTFDAEPRILPADLQGDGRVDFVTKDERELHAFVGAIEHVARPRGRTPGGPDLQRLHVGDLRGEGRLEVIAIAADGVAIVQGLGRADEAMIADLGLGPVLGGAIVDLDRDGAAEILVAVAEPAPHLEIVRVTGDAIARTPWEIAGDLGDAAIDDLIAADLDGDGRVDLLALRAAAGASVIAYGSAGEPPRWTPAPALVGVRAHIGDLDDDGAPDLLVVDADGGYAVRWRDLERRWSAGPSGDAPAIVVDGQGLVIRRGPRLERLPFAGRDPLAPLALVDDPDLEGAKILGAGDLDGDGDPDLVTGDGAVLHVWLARKGALLRGAELPARAPRDLAIADIDGRGRGELLGISPAGTLWMIAGEAP